jgi:hypothetical protein
MAQVARNATMQDSGYLNGCRYLLHDRDLLPGQSEMNGLIVDSEASLNPLGGIRPTKYRRVAQPPLTLN